MGLIDNTEINFLGDNFFGRLSSNLLMAVLGINKVNNVYDSLQDVSSDQYAEKALQHMGISYTTDEIELGNIPKKGAVIIVANHPTGAPDGLMLIDMISKIRPDVKLMGNYLLGRIEPLKDYFIDVDPFSKGAAKTVGGIKASFAHLHAGGALVIFPAGEVSTYQKGGKTIEDKEWEDAIIRFIAKCKVPILPIYIEAKNSTLFHLAGKIRPILRTALLPHEMINKKGQTIHIRIASVLSSNLNGELTDLSVLKRFLRANIYTMGAKKAQIKENKRRLKEIVPPIAQELLSKDIESLDDMRLLTLSSYSLYFCKETNIPNIIKEIGRLREVTFRSVGEGTGKEIDLDRFDHHYHHLFIWDAQNKAIVGAYRVGMGAEIMETRGSQGFYTNTLFVMTPPMTNLLGACIELGRSFIAQEYQKKSLPLSMIWKGILYILLSNPNYRYLLGPVTISGNFTDTSKLLIVDHLKKYYLDENIAKGVRPTTGLKKLDVKSFDPSKYQGISSMENIDKLVFDIEAKRLTMPILIKKYLLLNSNIIGFNVDTAFNNSLDALTLLDVTCMPEKTIQMLSKELDIDVDLSNKEDYEVNPERGTLGIFKIKISGTMKYYQLKILKFKEKFGRLKY